MHSRLAVWILCHIERDPHLQLFVLNHLTYQRNGFLTRKILC